MECGTQQDTGSWPNLYIWDSESNRTAVKHCPPTWSRLRNRNRDGIFRNIPLTRLNDFDVEITDQLWSLWGTLHPESKIFEADARGNQYPACYVIAFCAAKLFALLHWTPQMLDAIVVHGDRYYCESLCASRQPACAFTLEHLNTMCHLDDKYFHVRISLVACGQLYNRPTRFSMNVTTSLLYFFRRGFKFCILQCGERALAIGRSHGKKGGYFMYDCQSKGDPLFAVRQGASYLLRTTQLQMLLYCIAVTLSNECSSAEFTLYRVELRRANPDKKHCEK